MDLREQPAVPRVVGQQLTTDDQRLVAAIQRKDRKATAEFVERFGDAVYRFLRARLFPRPERADDLFQETFLAAWEHLADFRGESTLEAWLLGIARHKVEDYYRLQMRNTEPLDTQAEDSLPSREGENLFNAGIDDAMRQRRIIDILSRLPDSYALVLIWRYWEKRSAKEMAEMSGKTEKAVERLLARARTLFRKRWQGE